MAGVVRLGDMSTGHGAWPPRANISASTNVFVNGKGAHRVGDGWAVHCNPTPECHSGVASSGSSSVYVNGRAITRIGDAISCGDSMATGSNNVFAGG